MKQNRTAPFISNVLTVLVLLAFVFPFFWMLLASFKTQADMLSMKNFFVFKPTLNNYSSVIGEYKFLYYIANSFIVALCATLFALVLGLPAAYGITKYKMHGLGFVVLIVKIIPGITFLIPWYILFSSLNLVDSLISLILSHMLIGLPYIIWIMIPFFQALPDEIQESGLIDGCTKLQVFLRIVLPISTPGYVTCFLMSFIHSWNNFMFSMILSGDRTKTLPVAVFNFISSADINWGALMAAACVITLPILVISLLTQRYIVSGLSAGAVKG